VRRIHGGRPGDLLEGPVGARVARSRSGAWRDRATVRDGLSNARAASWISLPTTHVASPAGESSFGDPMAAHWMNIDILLKRAW